MSLKLPGRPAANKAVQVSKLGNSIKLVTNMFPLSIEKFSSDESQTSNDSKPSNNLLMCFQYDVDFEPEVAEDNRVLRYKIFRAGKTRLESLIGKFCFSGKSLFTLQQLSPAKIKKIEDFKSSEDVSVDGVNYSMRVKFTKEFSMDEDEARGEGQIIAKKGNKVNQVLNVILKTAVRNLNFQEIGKNSKFFDLKSLANIDIANRDGKIQSVLQAYKGFQFGTHPSSKKLYLMVDFASRILRKETALEFINKLPMDQRDQIIGESVITDYNNYTIYKIDGIDTTKSPASTFVNLQTNQKISFAAYYKQRYDITVKDMKQPLLLHIRKFREANTNVQKTEQVFLIPELCKMTGMTDEQRSNFSAMKDLSQHTKLTPEARYQTSLKYGEILAKNVRANGLKVTTSDSSVNALALSPPVISFGGNKTLTPKDGNYDFKNQILDKSTLKDWSFVYQQRDQEQADNFIRDLKKCATTYGINVEDPFYFEARSLNSKDWINTLENDFEKNNLPSFVLTLAPQINQSKALYQDLKKYLYSETGLEHQHVSTKSIQKNSLSVSSKILLQIAAKTGARLWNVQTPSGLSKNTMIIGIETSMKKILENKKMKQVVGVVASVNADLTKYYSEVDVRTENDTLLPSLSSIIAKSITAYVKNTKSLPEDIIIYRQGLGEGQVVQSLKYEIESIKHGFNEYKQGYKPKFAFFQVNKKIGQKFYQGSSQSGTTKGPLQNPVSGSLISEEVVGSNFEFYLCAQNCNSGVCTPTKYTCLHNDTNLSEGTFWQLTYFQCYNYYNWQGPVRVPASMMYAGKLAKFTSDVLEKKAHTNLTSTLYYL